MMPNTACLIGNWSPPSEKSRFTAFVFSGVIFGTVIGQSLADKHPWIGENEKQFLFNSSPSLFNRNITKTYNTERKTKGVPSSRFSKSLDRISLDFGATQRRSVPWGEIFRSRSVWSLLICHVCFNWAFYTLVTGMPSYMSRVLGFSITQNGLFSSIPYVAQSIVSLSVAYCSDFLIARKYLSTTWVRKLNNLIALGGLGFGLICVAVVGCNRTAAVTLFAVTIGLMGFSFAGYGSNSLDLAPMYSGNIISITNTAATLPGIFGPLVIGYLTKKSSSVHNWLLVFSITAGIAWFGALVNLCMTSGEIQPWSRPSHINTYNNNNSNSNNDDDQLAQQRQTTTSRSISLDGEEN
ncbi:unnamed protein product [Heterobilharzia americana]|nr:unnamed protein product [Heterobilharzia americana]